MSLLHPRTLGHSRVPRLAMVGLAIAGLVVANSSTPTAAAGPAPAKVPSAAPLLRPPGRDLRPVGIVDATPKEQAAILSLMKNAHPVVLLGYTFWVGTMDGLPVVSVAGGEDDEAAELVTVLLDESFHPKATFFSGTAGAANNDVNVGDVVMSGFVVDKRAVEYNDDGTQITTNSAEVHQTASTDLLGALVVGTDHVFPTPADASTYNSTTQPKDPNWQRVIGFAATKQLVTAAVGASATLGTTPKADATGVATDTGTVTNKVVIGTISGGAIWTNPLSFTEAQNMLYQTDAEEDEGLGFAFANATAGVPWALVRGISDTPWYSNAYEPVLAATRAAKVTRHLIDAVGSGAVGTAPIALADLSPIANATRAGYLTADSVAYSVSPVTEVGYTDTSGMSQTLTPAQLAALESEYASGAGDLG